MILMNQKSISRNCIYGAVGDIHLGNYLGTIKQFLGFKKHDSCVLLLAAITIKILMN